MLVGSEATPRVYNTTVKAYQGWAYLTLTFEKYGIATSTANLKTKMTFTAKSNNIKTTWPSENYVSTYVVDELPGQPQDAPSGTTPLSRLVFGHKGCLGISLPTTHHIDGLLRLFRVTTGTVLSISQIATNWNALLNTLALLTPKDLKYSGRFDFQIVKND